MQAITPTIFNVRVISLSNNCLRSCAASVVAKLLAANPCTMALHLNGNMFNDDDAAMFATSLKSNTNLLRLNLSGNNFTEVGIKTLYKSIFDDESLNSIHDSNHTCWLNLFADGEPIPNGIDESMLYMNREKFDPFPIKAKLSCLISANGNLSLGNKMLQVEERRRVQVLHALLDDSVNFNMQYLDARGANSAEDVMLRKRIVDDIPMELMPKVLAFLRKTRKYTGTDEMNLDRMFQVVRSAPYLASFFEPMQSTEKDRYAWVSLVALSTILFVGCGDMATKMKIVNFCLERYNIHIKNNHVWYKSAWFIELLC